MGIKLSRYRFLTQQMEIYGEFEDGKVKDEVKELTMTLVRFSFEPAKIKESFERAARTYRMDLAYPEYIPAGFKQTLARLDPIAPQSFDPEPAPGTLFLTWEKNEKSIHHAVFGRPTIER